LLVSVFEQHLVAVLLEAGAADPGRRARANVRLVDDGQPHQSRRHLTRDFDREIGGPVAAGRAFETNQNVLDHPYLPPPPIMAQPAPSRNGLATVYVEFRQRKLAGNVLRSSLPRMWEHYRKRFWGMQAVIVTFAVGFYLTSHRGLVPAALFFATMQLGSLLG